MTTLDRIASALGTALLLGCGGASTPGAPDEPGLCYLITFDRIRCYRGTGNEAGTTIRCEDGFSRATCLAQKETSREDEDGACSYRHDRYGFSFLPGTCAEYLAETDCNHDGKPDAHCGTDRHYDCAKKECYPPRPAAP